MVRHVCTLFFNCMIISLYLCCWTETYLSYWRVTGADAHWSTSSPCSQQTDYVAFFYRWACSQMPSLFQQSVFGLAVQDLGAWLGIFKSAHSHKLLQVIIKCMMDWQHKYVHFNHISLINSCVSKGLSDLAPFCMETLCSFK